MRSLRDAFQPLADRGLLDLDDPAIAAEQFAFLVMGASMDRSLFEPDGAPPPVGVVKARAEAGVDAFLRAHAVRHR